MKNVVIVKYGELTLKKDNINYFLKLLYENVEKVLSNIEHEIKYDRGRMIITSNYLDDVVDKLKYVCGIHEIIMGYLISSNEYESVKNNVLDLLNNNDFKTFKVETKRTDKKYPIKSMDFSKKLGGDILKNINDIKVDVVNPDLKVNVEIRKDETLVYFNAIKALGGYPVSAQGKGLLMLSGGIDSPIAGYLAIKKGIKLEAIYFESPPHTSEDAKNKVKDLASILSKYNLGINLHVVSITKIQEEILKNIPRAYLVTILRRMMYRIALKIALKNKCKVLVNGESIGQVASQTLTSMSVINEVVNIPVIRPLACFDKIEIIELAKKINTYDISIRPYEDCCTIFVPEHPVINPVLDSCIEYEKSIPFDEYINEAVKNEEVIKIRDNIKVYSDLL